MMELSADEHISGYV